MLTTEKIRGGNTIKKIRLKKRAQNKISLEKKKVKYRKKKRS
jgi:hypothetical protein